MLKGELVLSLSVNNGMKKRIEKDFLGKKKYPSMLTMEFKLYEQWKILDTHYPLHKELIRALGMVKKDSSSEYADKRII